MSAPVAIANAVADALGVDEVELPLTPARVWELLREAGAVHLRPRRLGRPAGGNTARAWRRRENLAGGRASSCAQHAALRPGVLVDLNFTTGLDEVTERTVRFESALVRQATAQRSELVRTSCPLLASPCRSSVMS